MGYLDPTKNYAPASVSIEEIKATATAAQQTAQNAAAAVGSKAESNVTAKGGLRVNGVGTASLPDLASVDAYTLLARELVLADGTVRFGDGSTQGGTPLISLDTLTTMAVPTALGLANTRVGKRVGAIRTEGYATVGDGGGAVYELTASPSASDRTITSKNGLVFALRRQSWSALVFGASRITQFTAAGAPTNSPDPVVTAAALNAWVAWHKAKLLPLPADPNPYDVGAETVELLDRECDVNLYGENRATKADGTTAVGPVARISPDAADVTTLTLDFVKTWTHTYRGSCKIPEIVGLADSVIQFQTGSQIIVSRGGSLTEAERVGEGFYIADNAGRLGNKISVTWNNSTWTDVAGTIEKTRHRIRCRVRVTLYGGSAATGYRICCVENKRSRVDLDVTIKNLGTTPVHQGVNCVGVWGTVLKASVQGLQIDRTNYGVAFGRSASTTLVAPDFGQLRRSIDLSQAKDVTVVGGELLQGAGSHYGWGVTYIGTRFSAGSVADIAGGASNTGMIHVAGGDVRLVNCTGVLAPPFSSLFGWRTDFLEFGGSLSVVGCNFDIDCTDLTEDPYLLDFYGPSNGYDTTRTTDLPSHIHIDASTTIYMRGPAATRRLNLLRLGKNYGAAQIQAINVPDLIRIECAVKWDNAAFAAGAGDAPRCTLVYTNFDTFVGNGPRIVVRNVPDLTVTALPVTANKVTARADFDIEVPGKVRADLRSGGYRSARIVSPSVSYPSPSGTAIGDETVTVTSPVTGQRTNGVERVDTLVSGGTLRMRLDRDTYFVVLSNPLDTLTLQLPADAPFGHMVRVVANQTVTNATWDGNGIAVSGGSPASLTAYQAYIFEKVNANFWIWRRTENTPPGETTVASSATVNIGNIGTLSVVITGSSAITSLGTSPNRFRFLRFTGALTLTHNTTSLILPGGANIVTAAGDTAIAVSDGAGNWRVIGYQRADGGSSPAALTQVDVITATGTWTKPTWARELTIIAVGAGGGGGSGRRGAAGSVRTGGGGGGAGGLAEETFLASELAATLSIEIGAGGLGGAAVAADNANGNPGGQGGNARVVSSGVGILGANGGTGGQGGSTGSAGGGLVGGTFTLDTPGSGNGAASSGTGGVANQANNGFRAGAGAGAGGGITSGDVPSAGGFSGYGYLMGNNRFTGQAAGGNAPGGIGGAGPVKGWSRGFGGAGGGGAGGNAAGTVAGGAGGAGNAAGGPGGGGGASTNGAASGAGGNGGDAVVYIIAHG